MMKADLKNKWGKYCDTDKLVNDMIALLKQYRHRCSEYGVCEMLNTYFKNKEPLIKMIAKSPNYIGDMRICTEKEFDRKITQGEVTAFFNRFYNAIDIDSMKKLKDDNGKDFNDYFTVGETTVSLDNLVNNKKYADRLKNLSQFDYSRRYTRKSFDMYNYALSDLRTFSNICTSSLTRDYHLNNGIELHNSMKTGRAFNKVCTHYGIDKLNPQTTQVEENGKLVEKVVYPYNKLFAHYSDMVSGLVRKMDFVISVNPLDYLTMSYGVSWRSCHMIDGGTCQGGCLSYMLDESSIVTFVIDNTGDPIHTIPRLYRQMIHYYNGMFMQNRLYPQGNDGATNLYDKFRDIITEEFSPLLKVEHKWKVECGVNACRNRVASSGIHYKDYQHNNSCTIFYPDKHKDFIMGRMLNVGHSGICPNCGKSHTNSNIISHGTCTVPTTKKTNTDDWDWTF